MFWVRYQSLRGGIVLCAGVRHSAAFTAARCID